MIYRKKIFLTVPSSFQVLILFFISLLLLIGFWRFVFVASHLSQLQLNNFILYIQSFFVALRLDAVVVSYFCLPVLLTIFLPYIGWASNIYRKIIFLYFCTTVILYSLIAVVDIEFYKELGTHLNILVSQPNAHSREFWQFAWQEYPIIFYLIGISFIAFFWLKFTKHFIPNRKEIFKTFLVQICFFLIGFILIGTCIRGGWQERPIDWGHAMFSKNQLANQIALNPLFNLGRSIIQLHSEKNISRLIHFMDNDSAFLISRNMIITSNERYLDTTTFKREIINPISVKPHIVLVILESFLGSYCGFINQNNKDVTPNLTKLLIKA